MERYLKYNAFQIGISQGARYLILFILWPFLAFITALKNYSNREAKIIVYLFLVYYGLSFVLGNAGVDAERYAINLKFTSELPFSDFFKIVGGLYSDTTVDIAQPLVTFIVSRFTSHPGVLFGVWTAIMGFFYLKSINLLHKHYSENPGWNAFIFMFFFIMLVPIFFVGGVRMPTAIWMFFYGACHVVLNRDPRYLVLTAASSLVHWSFLSANVVLLIYFILGNRNLLYIPVVISSFVLPGLLGPVFQTIAVRMGGPIQARYEGYSSEGYIRGLEDAAESASWFLGLSENMVYYYLLIMIFAIYFLSNTSWKSKPDSNLFSFLLLFLAFVNFGKVIPTFGGRFQTVFFLFSTLYIFLHMVKKDGTKINLTTAIGLFPMALYSLVNFRVGSESISAWIFAPGFGLPFFVNNISIADFLFR